jgi:hypothetical protein
VRLPNCISTGAKFHLCSTLEFSSAPTLSCHDMTMTTRSSEKNLNGAMESTSQQLKDEVERVCAANARTEKQLQSLMSLFLN